VRKEDLESSLRSKGWVLGEDGQWRRPSSRRLSPSPVVEQAPVDAPTESPRREALYPGRVLISIVSHRRRLTDEDNLCGKFFTDCLRYSGIISDDCASKAAIRITQVHIKAPEEERTEITVTAYPEGHCPHCGQHLNEDISIH